MQLENPQIPEDLYYDGKDYWIKVTGDEALVGMTENGQNNVGDILYLELVPAGTVLLRGEKFGSIESGKWVGNLVAPLSGLVLEVNRRLEYEPGRVNADAYGDGWMFRMQMTDAAELNKLMNPHDYKIWLEEQMCLAAESEISS